MSIWSQVNLAKVERLIAEARMAPPGLAAYAARDPDRANLYSFENRPRALRPPYAKRFREDANAWRFFESTPPSYCRTAIFWVLSAKKDETRERRLEELIAHSAAGLRLRQLTPYPRRKPQRRPDCRDGLVRTAGIAALERPGYRFNPRDEPAHEWR